MTRMQRVNSVFATKGTIAESKFHAAGQWLSSAKIPQIFQSPVPGLRAPQLQGACARRRR